MQVWIKNGSSMAGESLCRTCRHAHIQTGYRQSEELVHCNFAWDSLRRVPFNVRDCTDYAERNTPTLDKMWEIALYLDGNTHRSAGFRARTDEAAQEPELVCAK